MHSGMEGEVEEPKTLASLAVTHPNPLGLGPGAPAGGEKRRQLPRGVFLAEVARWLLRPRELAPCITAQIDLIRHTACRGLIWKTSILNAVRH